MHTNQQTIKKNYLNQIKEIFWQVGLTTQDPFILFFLFSTILWCMHTNQQTIKKNYLNQIKEIFWQVGLTTQDPFIFFFSVFHDLPSCSSSLQGTCGRTWEAKKSETFFFFSNFLSHPDA